MSTDLTILDDCTHPELPPIYRVWDKVRVRAHGLRAGAFSHVRQMRETEGHLVPPVTLDAENGCRCFAFSWWTNTPGELLASERYDPYRTDFMQGIYILEKDILMQLETTTKGVGILLVSAESWELLGKPQDREEWETALQLPDTYEFWHCAKAKDANDFWRQGTPPGDDYLLYLRHTAIPLSDDPYVPLAKIAPTYLENVETGELRVETIAIQAWRDGGYHTIHEERIIESEVPS